MTNNLKAMHDAFARHNASLGETRSGGIKTMLNEKSLMPGKPQTPLQHQSVEKAAKASAATRSNSSLANNVQSALRKSGLPDTSNVTISPPKKPGFGPGKFGTKKVF